MSTSAFILQTEVLLGRYSSYSIMGANVELFNDKYCMYERNVYITCMCENNEHVTRVCMEIKDLVDIRDTTYGGMW